jgi:hypothetical protein
MGNYENLVNEIRTLDNGLFKKRKKEIDSVLYNFLNCLINGAFIN